ncbi:MAG: chorismate-binding protein, partial [Mariprofundus sp.]|nr:chorismate-binding protein [Mariprofundus sp.]
MIFRVITNKGREHSAYGLFSSFPDQFAAILEDPSGEGKQFLVSSRGESTSLPQHASEQEATHFFNHWKANVSATVTKTDEHSPAIRCLVYAAYEAGGLIEDLPEAKTAVHGPVLWTLYPDFSFCFDDKHIHLAASNEQSLKSALVMLDEAVPPSSQATPFETADLITTSAAQYKKAVQQVKDYIAAGDVFQANIARFWQMPFEVSNLTALYDRLRQVNSAPFSSFARIGSGSDSLYLISASPERLFRIHADGKVDTRPIAGTRRRAEGDKDDALRAEMLLSEKERAEHIMLVDLERNDLGRVCKPGTVEVNEAMAV